MLDSLYDCSFHELLMWSLLNGLFIFIHSGHVKCIDYLTVQIIVNVLNNIKSYIFNIIKRDRHLPIRRFHLHDENVM